MNEQIQNPEVDSDEDDAPFEWRLPYWCQVRPDDESTDDSLDIINSLDHLAPRLKALGDAMSVMRPSEHADDTPRGLGYILEDYAQQLEDFSKYVYARFRARPDAAPAKPAPEPRDPLDMLRSFRENSDRWRQVGEESFKAKADEALRELRARVEAGERARADLAEAERLAAGGAA